VYDFMMAFLFFLSCFLLIHERTAEIGGGERRGFPRNDNDDMTFRRTNLSELQMSI